jgi:hypothetical protein
MPNVECPISKGSGIQHDGTLFSQAIKDTTNACKLIAELFGATYFLCARWVSCCGWADSMDCGVLMRLRMRTNNYLDNNKD